MSRYLTLAVFTDINAPPYFRYSFGRMYCGSHKGTFPEYGAFDRTCSDVSVANSPYENTAGRPVLRARCEKHPYMSDYDRLVLYKNDPLEVYSHVDLMDCLARSFWRTGSYDTRKGYVLRCTPCFSFAPTFPAMLCGPLESSEVGC